MTLPPVGEAEGLATLMALEQAALTQDMPWPTVAQELATIAQVSLRCDRVQIWWANTPTDPLSPLIPRDRGLGADPAGLALTAWTTLLQQGICTWATPAEITAAWQDGPLAGSPLINPTAQALYLLPLQTTTGAKGLLVAERWRQEPWRTADHWIGRSLGQTLVTLHHQRHHQQLQQQLQQQDIWLAQYQAELSQTTQAWQESQSFIHSMLNASTCMVYLYDRSENRVIYSNHQVWEHLGYTADDVTSQPGHFLQAVIHAADHDAVQQQRHQWWQHTRGHTLRMEYRVRAKDGQWRWLLVQEARFIPDAPQGREQVIGTATDVTDFKTTEAALRAANAQLQHLAITDELTQLTNRRHFDHCLHETWDHMLHAASPVTLMLCDIDYFKRYNDHYGHLAGDRCLQQVAQIILQAAQRHTDVVCRYGGEEFAILLPNTDVTGAEVVAQRIQQRLLKTPIDHPKSPLQGRVTLSLGIATWTPVPFQAAQQLVAAADHALYAAKSAGRDRYQIATPTVDPADEVPPTPEAVGRGNDGNGAAMDRTN